MDPTAPEPGAAPAPEPGPGPIAAAAAPAGLPDPRVPGPLDRETALAFLAIGDRLLASGEFAPAAGYYQRVVGFDDPAITAAATLGFGNALFRLDRDSDALLVWRDVLKFGATPSTYPALRQIAAALVRADDLTGAAAAYREADKLAPPADKAEIASRLGWLAKETGDARGARRYFARSRGTTGLPIPLTYIIIAVTVVVSLTTMTPDGGPLLEALWLDKAAVAAGEWWRLFTVTLVHDPTNLLHLGFNMYALYLVGPIVETIYGWKLFGLMYLLCALAGSVLSFVVGDPSIPAVGASGAIFGLFGVVLAATRIHAPVLDRRGRALVGQIGMLIAINLIFGFSANAGGGNIDNAAHIGGLLAGLWLGFVLVPTNVRTARDVWLADGGATTAGAGEPGGVDRRLQDVVRLLAVVALVAAILVGLAIGSDPRRFAAAGTVATVATATVKARRRRPGDRVRRSPHPRVRA